MKALIGLLTVFLTSTFSSALLAVTLTGSGASQPDILFQAMVDQYTTKTQHTISYTPNGSGQGIEDLKVKKVDFAATDVPIHDDNFVNIPVVLGAVGVVYNLPDSKQLKLSPELLVEIFLGRITHWDDSRIQSINKHFNLPNTKITVVTRSDESGSNHLFTGLLSSASRRWRRAHGTSLNLNLDYGKQVKGSHEMSKTVADTPGAISYVGWQYAEEYNLNLAAIENREGYFVLPNVDSILSAVSDTQPDDVQALSFINSDSKYGYPITGVTWVMIRKEQDSISDYEHAKSLVKFVKWMTQQGQFIADEHGYPPLPNWVVNMAKDRLHSITFSDIILY